MNKLAIFDAVAKILTQDSSTKKDISGANPEKFRQKISEDMSDADFQYLMESYVASFGVLSHISFHPKKSHPFGFRLRSTPHGLYVVDAYEETGLQKGDQIVAIDGLALPVFFEEHKDFFVSKTVERQYMDWAKLVKGVASIEVIRDGQSLHVVVAAVSEVVNKPAFESHFINSDTYYMRMENFHDEAGIASLYESSFPKLAKVKYLIIDVRINHGGSDSLYFPLFPYALSVGKGFKDLNGDGGFGMEILYTPTNVAHRLKQFEDHLADPAILEESKRMIEGFIKELEANQDKGYQTYGEDEDDYFGHFIGLEEAPEKILVLSDVTCGSSGDNFVDIMRQMPKVTVIGRPTMGILDYSNCCVADFGDYELLYPTSRSLAVDAGLGMTDKGVLPDIEIPWTPEHIERDVDLAVALDYLTKYSHSNEA